MNELLVSTRFYLEFYEYAKSDFGLCRDYFYLLQDSLEKAGDDEMAKSANASFMAVIREFSPGSGSGGSGGGSGSGSES